MKKFLFAITLTVLAASQPPAFCAPPSVAEKFTQNILLRDGVFFPSYAVANKSYYGGELFDAVDMTGPNAPWRTDIEDIELERK